MLTCREVSARAVELHAGELGFFGKLKLKLHLFMCRHCQRHLRQMALLLGALRDLRPDAGDPDVDAILHSAREQSPDRDDNTPKE